jgi:periplasmic copper chaperone A
MKNTIRRGLGALGAAGVLVAVAAAPVAAHVTVSSPDAAPGGYGKLVFRVPNESDAASTTKLQVTLPEDTPFAHVSPKPLPGWDVEVDEVKLPEPVEVNGATLTHAARMVTWTAQGEGIAVGMFDEFELVVGAIPEDATTLTFPAVQTYSDGEVVRWDQPTPESGEEPEYPAPVLDLAASASESGDSHDDGAEADEAADDAAVEPVAETSESDGDEDASDTTARTLAVGGLILGVVALGSTLLRRRREGGD